MKYAVVVGTEVEARSEDEARKKAKEMLLELPEDKIQVRKLPANPKLLVVLHRNVDADAIISAFLYTIVKTGVFEEDEVDRLTNDLWDPVGVRVWDIIVTTEEAFTEAIDVLYRYDVQIAILDTPNKDFARGFEIVDHIDHHDGSAPSTAAIIAEKYGSLLPEWAKYLVELANYADTGKVLRQPAPIKYFHITGYINALRTLGYSDIDIIEEIFRVLVRYRRMLEKLVEAEKLIEDVQIIEIGKYKVAIVENKPHTVNQTLFENGVDLIVFRDGNNIGVTRNANNSEPDLTKLKPEIEKMLREKGRPEEAEEWFFHPAGFLAARGTRKHPAETPSALSPEDLVVAITRIV